MFTYTHPTYPTVKAALTSAFGEKHFASSAPATLAVFGVLAKPFCSEAAAKTANIYGASDQHKMLAVIYQLAADDYIEDRLHSVTMKIMLDALYANKRIDIAKLMEMRVATKNNILVALMDGVCYDEYVDFVVQSLIDHELRHFEDLTRNTFGL